MRKDGGSFHAHGDAPLEISAHQQGHSGYPLHAVQERRQRVRLGLPHHPAVGRIGENEAADLGFPNQPREAQVLARPRIRRRALERDEDQLRHLIAQRHASHPVADGGRRLGGRGRLGEAGATAGRGRGCEGRRQAGYGQGEQRVAPGLGATSPMPGRFGGFWRGADLGHAFSVPDFSRWTPWPGRERSSAWRGACAWRGSAGA
jgi:hypothetical protein